MNDEGWEGNACFHSNVEHTLDCISLFAAMTRLTLKSCTGPTELSSGRLVTGRVEQGGIQKYASTLRSSGYHARLRATVTEFTSLRSHPSLRPRVRCASRSWVALPPNKLSPPHHLHKSIKSVLVEFEASRPPELVISRYETRIGAGENVRQMFARSEARSFVSVLVEGSFVSFISFFGGERGYLFSFFVVFALYIIVYI